MIFARSSVDRAGGWHSELTRSEDLDFVVRCLTHRLSVARWHQGAAIYRGNHSGEQLGKRYDDRSSDLMLKAHRSAYFIEHLPTDRLLKLKEFLSRLGDIVATHGADLVAIVSRQGAGRDGSQ